MEQQPYTQAEDAEQARMTWSSAPEIGTVRLYTGDARFVPHQTNTVNATSKVKVIRILEGDGVVAPPYLEEQALTPPTTATVETEDKKSKKRIIAIGALALVGAAALVTGADLLGNSEVLAATHDIAHAAHSVLNYFRPSSYEKVGKAAKVAPKHRELIKHSATKIHKQPAIPDIKPVVKPHLKVHTPRIENVKKKATADIATVRLKLHQNPWTVARASEVKYGIPHPSIHQVWLKWKELVKLNGGQSFLNRARRLPVNAKLLVPKGK